MFSPDGGFIELIVNPKSGSSSNKLLVTEFKAYLEDRGFDVRTGFTLSLDHACRLAQTAAGDKDCQLVAAAGGDGTIREVAHGLAGSGKPLLIVPAGTENLLGNEMGFDLHSGTLIKAFEGNCIRTLDLGNANGKCFTSIVGFGFDGTVVKIVSENRKGHINHMAYFWPLWQTFWGHKFPKFEVIIDDNETLTGRGMVFVGNISRYAIGLQLLHYADFGDGKLDVCFYKCSNKIHLIKHSLMTVLKKHADRPDVEYRQCRKVTVKSGSKWVNIEIDGDPGPSLPLNIEVIPKAVKVVVPPEAKPAGIRTRLLRMIS